MLRIFYGRENIDKAAFLYRHAGRSATVLVPDQFTLEAEKEALRCLGAEGLFDLEISSFSRLGSRLLSETGGVKKRTIDRYGRHILLTSVIEELAEKGELAVYGTLAGRNSFTELVNDFVASLKQNGVSPAALQAMRAQLPEGELLSRKLADMEKIYERYQARLSGNFLDTEDYIDLYIPAAAKSRKTAGREFWIYGFDSFAPKTEALIAELMRIAEVNLLVTAAPASARDGDLFALTRALIGRFRKRAADAGIACEVTEMLPEDAPPAGGAESGACICTESGNAEPEGAPPQNGVGAVLERELFALPLRAQKGFSAQEARSGAARPLTLTAAANCYSEAEAAAVYVTRLVRDEGLRYRDILVICNDLSVRGAIIRRVFAEYGIPVFTDEKRGILGNPAVVYVLSLLRILTHDYRTADVFTLLKTGLTPFARGEIEEMENYAVKYRIRGSFWKKPFRFGSSEYGEEEFARLENFRAALSDFLGGFEKPFKESRMAKDRVAALYRFLADDAALPAHLEEAARAQEEAGYVQAAQEFRQVWEAIVHILDQIVNVIGEEKPSMEMLTELFEAGFSSVELGLLPPAADGLVLGTMQRTRAGSVRALVVLGANDGVLPLEGQAEELLSEEEKMRLAQADFPVSELDEVRVSEERIAIYRAFSRPSEYLYLSYAASAPDGSEQRPSRIFDTVRRIFPDTPVDADIGERSEPLARMESADGALDHLVCALRENANAGADGAPLGLLADWYKRNEPEKLKQAMTGLLYRNEKKRLSHEAARALYERRRAEDARSGAEDAKSGAKDALVLSPSRLERYSRCPFAHFVAYGLRPEERRIFAAGAREIGDVYHDCLMRFSKTLSEPSARYDAGADDANGTAKAVPKWETVTRAESDALMKSILEAAAKNYKEGLFTSGDEEDYRRDRMQAVLQETAWMLVEQSRAGDIRERYFEERFGIGRAKRFAPITVNTKHGEVCIEGRIDRVDVLGNGAVKIIDYKSGSEQFRPEEASGGWRLQLMLYLKAATLGKDGAAPRKPAGVFYFMIRDAEASLDGTSVSDAEATAEILAEDMKKKFRMNGLLIDEADNVESIAGDFARYSDVVEGLQKVKAKDGAQTVPSESGASGFSYKGSVLSAEDFAALSAAFDAKIEELCRTLAEGEITARPKRAGEMTACRYCEYKSICRFDISIPGCRFEKIGAAGNTLL